MLIPPANNTITATNPKLPIKIESRNKISQTPVQQHQNQSNADGDKNCPICKNAEEDWDGEHQKQLQQTNTNTQTQNTQQKNSFQTQNMRQIQAQDPQHSQDYQVPQKPQCTQTQSFDVPDSYAEQICLRRVWVEKKEELNKK